MEKIKSLISNLQSMGYRRYQISSMIESCTGNKKLAELTEQEKKKLEEHLASQVDFALKCLKVTRGTS